MSVVPFDPNRRLRQAGAPALGASRAGATPMMPAPGWTGGWEQQATDPRDAPQAACGPVSDDPLGAPRLGAAPARLPGAPGRLTPPQAPAREPWAPRPPSPLRPREAAGDDTRLDDALARVAALERALIATLRENAQNWARAERAEARLALLDQPRPCAAPEA